MDELSSNFFAFESPSEKLDRAFTVRCPQCSQTYVSRTLKRCWFFTYRRYIVLNVVLFLAVLVAALL
ncbi:hypothetical protein [Roseateles sp. L2-2]|uniref:hypothetical protein n=1 Tax=Roseateles sp. L2-2 TaxID=3422597 RepID=UPI003D3618D2